MKNVFFTLWILMGATLWSADINPQIFGDMKARAIGPAVMSGRITEIDAPVNNSQIIYIGTAGGGVWKSTDGGTEYKPIFDEYPQSIGAIRVDPTDENTLWVGTGEINVRNSVSYGNGLYKTTDGGNNWKLMGFEGCERIAEIRIHPTDNKIIYVAVLGNLWSDDDKRGLYKTIDGGETWECILKGDAATGCIDVDIDPQEPNVVFAAMWEFRRQPWTFNSGGPGSGLFKSKDGGKTFEELTKGLSEGIKGRIDVDIAPNRPSRIYAAVESEETALYMSDDSGTHWVKQSDASNLKVRPFYLSTITVDPNNYNKIFNTSVVTAISEDAGKNWNGLNFFSAKTHLDHHAVWVNPKDSNHVIFGTDGGIYTSRDGGTNFNMGQGLPVSQFYRVSVDNQTPYNVYGGLQDNGSWRAPSAYPGGISNHEWVNIGNGDGFSIMADAKDVNQVYWNLQGGILYRLNLETQENKSINPYPEKGMESNRFNWNTPLIQSPNQPERLYYGAQYLYKTENRGETWQRISPDLTTDDPEKQKQEESGGLTIDVTTAENHCTIFAISESPHNENVIWVGTDDGNLQLTQDGGKTWKNLVGNIPNLPANTWVSNVRAGYENEATVYATFDGHRTGDKTVYIYKSTDFGQTWTSLATDQIEGHCHVIIQDAKSHHLLFLGTETGLFVSFDSGEAWVRFSGIPHVPIRDMVIQERERDLVIGTHGRGIYILDDITPLRHLNKEVLEQKVAILPSRPGKTSNMRTNQNFPGHNSFTAPNPRTGITLSYYLKKRHMFGDLKLEVLNAEGKKIADLSSGKRKGLNRAFWNMRLPSPIPVEGSFNFRSFAAPFVATGTYTIRLTKGKEVIETKAELLPSDHHSAEDRKIQTETVMDLYKLQETFSYEVTKINGLLEQIESLLEKEKKGKLHKLISDKQQKLKKYKEFLVAEGTSIYVTKTRFTDEILNLYGDVVGYSGRPTNDQIARTKTLTELGDQLLKDNASLWALDDLNNKLTKKKLSPLTLKTKEEWRKASNKKGAAPINTKNHYKNASKFNFLVQQMLIGLK